MHAQTSALLFGSATFSPSGNEVTLIKGVTQQLCLSSSLDNNITHFLTPIVALPHYPPSVECEVLLSVSEPSASVLCFLPIVAGICTSALYLRLLRSLCWLHNLTSCLFSAFGLTFRMYLDDVLSIRFFELYVEKSIAVHLINICIIHDCLASPIAHLEDGSKGLVL